MDCKKIVAIIRTGRLEQAEQALKGCGVRGITVTQVKGFGEYANFFSRDWMCVHARVELFVRADEVTRIVERLIEAAHTGAAGDGMVAVLPVEAVYRIRTKCPAACEEI
jgi:nitrogen regulatory protein P-II 1